MGLFGFLKKKPAQQRVNVEMHGFVNGKEVPLSMESKPDAPVSQAFYHTLQSQVKPIETKMGNLAVSLKTAKSVDERITTLTSLIDTFYSLKRKCNQLGPEYSKYFIKSWEHCHNSKNPDFNYIERFEKELSELRVNYDSIIAKESIHAKESVDLEQRVIDVIKNAPGLLQKDIYKQFNPAVKSDIQGILYSLDKHGIIHREKVGNSYVITLR